MDRVFITGDKHANFDSVEAFCTDYATDKTDILIVLGDAGINFFLDKQDTQLKEFLRELPITLFCIHGNHEARPEKLENYECITFHGNLALAERKYPNIIFAIDGNTYLFSGMRCIALGGAYSVDKPYRLASGGIWFDDEQPSEETKKFAEHVLDFNGWDVDVVLSHTCPAGDIPVDAFLPGIVQSDVDRSTEDWLQYIKDRLTFRKWFCGHWHIDRTVDNLRFVFNDFLELRDPSKSTVWTMTFDSEEK